MQRGNECEILLTRHVSKRKWRASELHLHVIRPGLARGPLVVIEVPHVGEVRGLGGQDGGVDEWRGGAGTPGRRG